MNKLKIYFCANIFLCDKTGVYRYSYEILSRMLNDHRLDIKLINNGDNSDKELEEMLKMTFGNEINLHKELRLFGHKYNREYDNPYLEKFLAAIVKFINNPIYLNKVPREWFRILKNFIIEKNRFISRYLLKPYYDKTGCLFTPYHDFKLNRFYLKKFKTVRVVHDIIPIIYPDYFEKKYHFKKDIFDKLNQTDLVITVSENTKFDILKHNKELNPKKIKAIPIATSEKFKYCSDKNKIKEVKLKYGIPNDSDYFFTLCTVEPRKNHIALLKAWEKVRAKIDLNNPVLVVGGKKGWIDEYQNEIDRQKSSSSSIVFTGFIDDEDLSSLYSNSVMSIYPSLYEGFGLPILESIKCNTFCLTSNISSMPEVTGNSVPLVNPKNVDDIAEKIVSISNNPDLLSELNKQQYERSKLFSWDITYENTIKAIKSLIGN